MKNIVVAVDFSNATPAVMEIAINLAKTFDAELQLLHVIEPDLTFVTYGFSTAEYPGMAYLRDETIRRAKTRMEELTNQARQEVPRVASHLPEGSPLIELLKQVKQSDADFVVIGSHGHGVLSSLLLGSVAEGMVRKASVPTLIVPVARQ